MNLLALDLGTNTGIAYNQGDQFIVTTKRWITDKEVTANHKSRLDRRCDPRLVRFYEFLRSLSGRFDAIVFEDVQFQTYRMQTQLWASFRTAVWLHGATDPRQPVIECVATNLIKQFATGSGGADKIKMTQALKRQHPQRFSAEMDDNAVDAAWLWVWGQSKLGRMKKTT